MKTRVIPFVIVSLLLALSFPIHAQNGEWASLNAEARALYQKGHYEQAVALVKRTLDIAEEELGPDYPNVTQTLNNLGLIFHGQGEYAQAEPLYTRSLAIWEKTLLPGHTDVATSLNNLALLYKIRGHYAEAEPLYQRSLAIWERAARVRSSVSLKA